MRATPEGDDRGPKWACFLNFPSMGPMTASVKAQGEKSSGGKKLQFKSSCDFKAAELEICPSWAILPELARTVYIYIYTVYDTCVW